MVTAVQSFSNTEKKYDLTIDERQGVATDCGCPDRQYRHHECKHMRQFNAEVQRAATFILLQRQVSDIEQTARINREMAFA